MPVPSESQGAKENYTEPVRIHACGQTAEASGGKVGAYGMTGARTRADAEQIAKGLHIIKLCRTRARVCMEIFFHWYYDAPVCPPSFSSPPCLDPENLLGRNAIKGKIQT